MSEKDLFLQFLEAEIPKFVAVFRALPSDKLDYKHPEDPKGKTAGELAGTIADEAQTIPMFLEVGIVDMSTYPWGTLKTVEDFVSKLEDGLNRTKSEAQKMTEEQWASQAKMMMGEKESWVSTRGGIAWGMLFDLVHHRGQLSTFIRPMGGKVPSIYGPSADTAE